jgi:SAM-dependent methyltransferase
MIQFLKTTLGKYKTMLLRKLVPSYRKVRGVAEEKNHWARLFSSKESLFSDPDFKNRANPDRLLQPELAKLLESTSGDPLVLDVGCGPLSTIGIVFQNRRVDLHGADPLADDYQTLLDSIGVPANCKLMDCPGQELVKAYGENKFDLVASVNALDHSESPMEVFKEMVGVCKVGGYIFLSHCENEGIHERYHGMHQWNFRKEGNKLVANDGVRSYELIAGLSNVVVAEEHTIPAKPRPFLEWTFKRIG